ncbi:MAG: nucleotide exchange factor GrpE [Gammaproteobacteria bacterium]|nr:nucleotide exchange factor GrpE [Gammaproteobacteria bacterium]
MNSAESGSPKTEENIVEQAATTDAAAPGDSAPAADAQEATTAKQTQNFTEDAAGEESGDTAKPSAEELLLALQEQQRKTAESMDQAIRARAEVENMRRRTERDVANAHKYALEKFALELLPIIDSLELGLAAVPSDEEATTSVREGMELTLKMFQTALEKFSVSVINPQGESFNPEHHQAMSMQVSTDVEPNTVLAVAQKGYLLNERLLRPAMVVVSQGGGGAPTNGGQVDEMA